MSNNESDFLVVILDLSPLAWQIKDGDDRPLTLTDALQHILIFLNAHLALKDTNTLAVYIATISTSRLLYTSSKNKGKTRLDSQRDANSFGEFAQLDEEIIGGIRDTILELDETKQQGHTGLVQALSRSLARMATIASVKHTNHLFEVDINRHQSTIDLKQESKSRILILSASTEMSSQYVKIMNCIFSAQKSSIPIDVCKIYGPDSVFLQQAAHLTTGAYLRLEHPSALLQYLMLSFLPSRSIRKHLNLPVQETVDLRAACFCHRKVIDLGYICSVCLSIFCSPITKCTTCGTHFSVASTPKKPRRSNLRNEVPLENGAVHMNGVEENGNPMEIDAPT